MADKRQPARRASSDRRPPSQKQTPIRRPDMIRCENCGEDYSSTYKRCPFCDERPGRTGIGGRRVAGGGGGRVHPIQVVWLVISLVVIIAALFIIFTRIVPLFTGGLPGGASSGTSQSTDISSGGASSGSGDSSAPDVSGDSSQGADASQGGDTSQDVTEPAAVTGITLNKTDITLQPGETFEFSATLAPAGATGTVTWSSSDTSLATVDEYGNVKNVNQGGEKKKAVITASCGSVTATCDVYCQPANPSSGSEEPSGGGTSTGGNTSGPVAANTPGTISGAGSGLNVRSGPGSSYDKIASVKNGDKVTILEDTGSGWYKVDIGGGVTGYVSSDYVSVS